MEMATIMTEKMTKKDKHDKVTIKGRPHTQTHYFQACKALVLFLHSLRGASGIYKISNNAMSLRHGCPMILVFVLN